MQRPPNKILRIRDAVFILPDNFEGSIDQAFTKFLEYQQSANKAFVNTIDPNDIYTPLGILLQDQHHGKVCLDCSIYEYVDGLYQEIPKTFKPIVE